MRGGAERAPGRVRGRGCREGSSQGPFPPPHLPSQPIKAFSPRVEPLSLTTSPRRHQWGERPHAFVVLKPSASWHGRHQDFEADLKKFGKGKMAPFAIPEWVEVVGALEKTSTGKGGPLL